MVRSPLPRLRAARRAVTAVAAVTAVVTLGGCGGAAVLNPPPLAAESSGAGRLAVVRVIASADDAPPELGPYLSGTRRGGGFEPLDSLGPDDTGSSTLGEGGGSALGPKIPASADATTLTTLLRERLRAGYDAMLKGKLEKARADVLSVAESIDRNLAKTAGDPLIWATRIEAYALLGQLETTLGLGTAKARYAMAAGAMPIDLDEWSDKPEAAIELSTTLQTELRSARLAAMEVRGRVSVGVRARGAKSIRVNGVDFKGEAVTVELVRGERYYFAALLPGDEGIPAVHAMEPGEDGEFDLLEGEAAATSAVTSVLVVDGLASKLKDHAARAELNRALAVYGQRALRAAPAATAVLLVLDVRSDADAGWVLVEATSCVRGGACRDATAMVVSPKATRAELLERAGTLSGRIARRLLDGKPEPTSASEL